MFPIVIDRGIRNECCPRCKSHEGVVRQEVVWALVLVDLLFDILGCIVGYSVHCLVF